MTLNLLTIVNKHSNKFSTSTLNFKISSRLYTHMYSYKIRSRRNITVITLHLRDVRILRSSTNPVQYFLCSMILHFIQTHSPLWVRLSFSQTWSFNCPRCSSRRECACGRRLHRCQQRRHSSSGCRSSSRRRRRRGWGQASGETRRGSYWSGVRVRSLYSNLICLLLTFEARSSIRVQYICLRILQNI